MRRTLGAPFVLALASSACAATPETSPRGAPLPTPVIDEVRFPDPALPGSPVLVVGGKLGTEAYDRVTLEIDAGDQSVTLVVADDLALESSPSSRWFRLDAQAHAALGSEGSLGATCIVTVERAGVHTARAERACGLRLATTLAPALLEDIDAEVFRDDRMRVAAADLLLPGEGALHLEVEGEITLVGGAEAVPVAATLPVVAEEAPRRDLARVVASSALGGIRPGTLEATMTLVSSIGGLERRAEPRRLRLLFRAPELHSIEPRVVSLGQLVTVSGGGFVATDDSSAGTHLELEGIFTGDDGASWPCCDQVLIPRSSLGREATVEIAAAVREDGLALVSELFGASRGSFSGTLTAVTTTGSSGERVATAPLPIDLALGTRQVVYVHFVPSFDASLERFGLGAASGFVREATLDRIRRIYEGYALDLRTDPPSDFAPRGYATLEIGGPDPNGVGLFGYDNTPGKDVGNLRLFDKIGGLNALTQHEADGAPGFGGVFIDSFLYWSEDPGLPGERPIGAPEPEPAFDAIFGPVRARAATSAEVDGTARDETRIAVVAEAVRVIAAIIGETAAHELGHSFGLAEPYGSPTVFHSLFPDEGCLMDEGAERPFAERAELPGAPETRFCADEPAYLASILGGV